MHGGNTLINHRLFGCQESGAGRGAFLLFLGLSLNVLIAFLTFDFQEFSFAYLY